MADLILMVLAAVFGLLAGMGIGGLMERRRADPIAHIRGGELHWLLAEDQPMPEGVTLYAAIRRKD